MKIKNLYELAILLRSKLKMAKWPFNRYGFPVFPREVILEEPPTLIEPIQRIRCCKNPNECLLCSFADDVLIKRRLRCILDEIKLYGKFKGFGGFDLSPRIRWSFQRQKFNIWLSQLATAFVALSGQKIIPNFRIGDLQTVFALESYPKNIPYVVGTLGCSKRMTPLHEFIFKTKLLITRPSHLTIYGPLREECERMMVKQGVDYNVVTDYRTRSYAQSAQRREI
ncbi:DUF4417 domain-containing protein [Fibrobacter sp. UWB5]|uniref:DUF4417 domain-containing protein n=1 Tax=Fibrobacter sp. UWB5 TaxID=1964360 RepID=UPI000B5207AE|nr:DUF4417 domain-containing protein [Fibrobacter sp. UWB5]OWV14134.1 hypothetical protein B7989_01295 [Fibrobacter sp. UWB5]